MRRIAPYLALGAIVVAAFAAFYSAGHAVSGGDALVMPLDDAYIHFQYARMIAAGQPFRYGPGEPFSSGGTSLIYPFLLALGLRVGFAGMNLSLWAVGIGLVCWVGSAWLMYRIVGGAIGFVTAVGFGLCGGLAFAYMSGMETGLMVFATLLTLYAALRREGRARFPILIGAALLVTVIRPEGLLIALGALAYEALVRRPPIRRWIWYVLPLGARLIQPLLNLFLTGSATASGMQAKSLLFNVPFDARTLVHAIAANFVNLWRELFFGTRADGVIYTAPLVGIVALVYVLRAVWRARRILLHRMAPDAAPILLVAGWLLALSAAVSILETAFWQFKRYQQPMIALLFVLFGWALRALWSSRVNAAPRRRQVLTVAAVAGIAITVGYAPLTLIAFRGYYADNVREVASFQIPMARYVAENAPPATRIGVHDAGVMAYVGGRLIYDVPGLSTPGAALAWRGGPGTMFEAMRASPYRPAWFAIYPDHHGLAYFVPTDLFRDVQARFHSTDPVNNVASATSDQWVTRADWSRIDTGGTIPPAFVATALAQGGPGADLTRVDAVNVANLDDERAHGYQWTLEAPLPGYATELYEQAYRAVPGTLIADGGRLITGTESFDVRAIPGRDMLWITRVHPRDAARVALYVGDTPIGTRVQPGGEGGAWMDIVSLVPGRLISNDRMQLRVVVESGVYMPYQHWVYAYGPGGFQPAGAGDLPALNTPFTGPDGAPGRLWLRAARMTPTPAVLGNPGQVTIEVDWEADSANPPTGDAKVFVHLYKDPNQAPAIQYDGRPGGGILPPANWLPGIVHETYMLMLPPEAGTYQIAIGLYDPVTGIRYTIQTSAGTADRLFLGKISVP